MGQTNYFMMLYYRNNGTWVSLWHRQDGVVVLPSEQYDTSLLLMLCYSCKTLQKKCLVGRLGGHHAELHAVTSVMALNHSLQLKELRQRGRREASYSLYHVSPQAAHKPTEAAGDLRCFLDLMLQVSRDMSWSSSPAPNPTGDPMSLKSADSGPWGQQHRCSKGSPRTAYHLMYLSMHETLQDKDCNLLDICMALGNTGPQPGWCL